MRVLANRAHVVGLVVGVLAMGCAGAVPAASPVPTSPFGSAVARECGEVKALLHQATDLERMLPGAVAGRELTRWSVRGRCALEMVAGQAPGGIDALVADFESPSSPPIDVDHIAYAIAGRSDVKEDPPYIVFAAARPDDDDEIYLNMLLLLGGADFVDVAAASTLDGFHEIEIAGKQVFAGTAEMLVQSDHQRGVPYLYETDDAMFVVISELEPWVREVFASLP